MMKRLAVAVAAVVVLLTPRGARAELWINLDPKLLIKDLNGSACQVARVAGRKETWSCKRSGSLWLGLRDPGKSGVCKLSFWSVGTRKKWHADLTDTTRLKCTFKWVNDSTIEFQAPRAATPAAAPAADPSPTPAAPESRLRASPLPSTRAAPPRT